MTNDNRAGIAIKFAINFHQHGGWPHNLGKNDKKYYIYEDLIFLNMFALKCINLKISLYNINA